MKDRRLRFALFGAGDFGPHFAPYINEVAELVAICDPRPEAQQNFVRQTGLAVGQFDNPESLLKSVDIDAVAITSPNFTHKDIAVAAARAGKHVYCEKAMANTVPECWEMVRACQDAGVRLMVGHKRRLRPPWARMIELRDRLGPTVAANACLYYDARPYDHHGWWTREAQCGGLLDVAGVHTIDWLRAMCGDVDSVRALAPPQVDSRYDFPDTLHVEMRFRDGAVATLTVSLVYPLSKFRESVGARVICRHGGMHLDTFLDHIDLYWQHQTDAARHHERFDDLGFDHAYRLEVGDFVRWIKEGHEPCLTWREGLRCVEVMEAAHRSAREGGKVIPLPLYPALEDSRCRP
jgi:UDP-N-acetyl-2-amino-2-deoxyglucuronate dehydrogenase